MKSLSSHFVLFNEAISLLNASASSPSFSHSSSLADSHLFVTSRRGDSSLNRLYQNGLKFHHGPSVEVTTIYTQTEREERAPATQRGAGKSAGLIEKPHFSTGISFWCDLYLLKMQKPFSLLFFFFPLKKTPQNIFSDINIEEAPSRTRRAPAAGQSKQRC